MQFPETPRSNLDSTPRASQLELPRAKVDELQRAANRRALRLPAVEAEEFYANPPCTD